MKQLFTPALSLWHFVLKKPIYISMVIGDLAFSHPGVSTCLRDAISSLAPVAPATAELEELENKVGNYLDLAP